MRETKRLMRLGVAAAVLFAGCADGGTTPDPLDGDVPPEFVDHDGDVVSPPDETDADDGCRPSEEICDDIDNDCDTVVDEGFDLTSDPENCGACGVSCSGLPNADGVCADAACAIGMCLYGYHDLNRRVDDGCEYACAATTSVESRDNGTCDDGIDNDCDGRSDEVDPDCSRCVPELCDGIDNDCDALIDEDYDLDFDPLHCGVCSRACGSYPHAVPACVLGECDIRCDPGWSDLNGRIADGCEIPCSPTPGGLESACDGVDDNCDGETDEDFVAEACGLGICRRWSVCHRGRVVPCRPRDPPATADAACNGVDEDCDGATDEEYAGIACGVGACSSRSACVDGIEVPCSPGLPLPDDRVCDGLDEDCDGATDEEYVVVTCGLGVCVRESSCVGGTPTCVPGPSGPETCDGVDNDCDGETDEPDAGACLTFYADRDADTFGAAADWLCLCAPVGQYTATRSGDCDDSAAAVNPAAVEACNGIDDDCDASTDPLDSAGCTNLYADADRDSYGTGAARCYCAPTGIYTATNADDCDDSNATRNPGVPETCSTAQDDDCDGVANERDAQNCTPYYRDADGDSYGTSESQCWCSPSGDFRATLAGDCNDSSAAINPGATERCNDVDDDCDGLTDEGFSCRIASTRSCTITVPTKTCNGTQRCSSACSWEACVVTDAEVCNGIDDNCDGVLDPENAPGCTNYYYDGDGDTYGVGAPRCYCGPTGAYRSANALDCDDANPARNPGLPENCATGIDDNCNGLTNEQNAVSCTVFYMDADGDTWGTTASQCWCAAVGNYRATRTVDCNDSVASINPGAAEACNDLDDDCDTLIDETFPCRRTTTGPCSVTVPTKTCNGTRTCSASCTWGSCVIPETGSNIETCNGVDDDCDGTVDDPPTLPNVLCAARPNANMTCSAGTCVIGSCTAGWADVNGVVTDGCECQLEPAEAPGTCGTATDLGTFSDAGAGSQTTVTGKIHSASDVDCFRFNATDTADTTCDNYHADIRFTPTGNPGTQFQFSVWRANCSTQVCTDDTANYNWRTDFTSGSGTGKLGECECRTANTFDYNLCADNSAMFYFCVSRRAGFSLTCDSYTIQVSNGVY